MVDSIICGRTYGRGNGKLYVGQLNMTDNFSYKNHKDSVLIEIEVESLNDVCDCIVDDTFEIKKGKVIRVVDKHEYYDVVKTEKDDFDDLLDLLC